MTRTMHFFAITLIVALTACGDSPAPASDAATPATSISDKAADAPTTPALEPAMSAAEPVAATTQGNNVTGIDSCDQYLNEYQACFAAAKVPPEAVESAKQGLEATRGTWQTLAKSPTTKAGLEASCKQALESLPQVKAALGC
jgi:hypothetical protein